MLREKALSLAAGGDISGALRLALALPEEESMRRLAGLCYIALGYPESAANFLPCEEDMRKSREILTAVSNAGNGWLGYRKALRLLRSGGLANVRMLLIEGCLHARRGKRRQAQEAFLRALYIDHGNVEAKRLLEGLANGKPL